MWGMHSHCLRKPAPTAHSIVSPEELANPERLWDVPSAATPFLIRVLVEYAFAKEHRGRLEDPTRASAAQDALQSFLNVIASQRWEFQLGPGVVWNPPQQPQSQDGAATICENLTIDCQQLLQRFPKWTALTSCMANAHFARHTPGKTNVLVLLKAAADTGPKACALLNQLVWGIGLAVERIIRPALVRKIHDKDNNAPHPHAKQTEHETQHTTDTQDPPGEASAICDRASPDTAQAISSVEHVAPARQALKASFAVVATKKMATPELTPYEVDTYLDSYKRGAEELFKNELQLSIAIDASRIGKKSVTICAMAKPSGEAAWAPPQINDDYQGESALAIFGGDGGEEDLQNAREAILCSVPQFLPRS